MEPGRAGSVRDSIDCPSGTPPLHTPPRRDSARRAGRACGPSDRILPVEWPVASDPRGVNMTSQWPAGRNVGMSRSAESPSREVTGRFPEPRRKRGSPRGTPENRSAIIDRVLSDGMARIVQVRVTGPPPPGLRSPGESPGFATTHVRRQMGTALLPRRRAGWSRSSPTL